MIRRELMLKVWPGNFRSKAACHRFESGRNGLTNRVTKRGLQACAITENFRLGNQTGVVIADNQTRRYAEADPTEKSYLHQLAWGPQ